MIRSLFTIVMTVVYTILVGVPLILFLVVSPGSERALSWGRAWSRLILRTAGVRVEASGLGNVDPKGTYVYLSNHQSNLDVLSVITTIPTPFRFVAKQFLFYIPIFGQAMWLMGMIPIDRARRGRAIRSLEKAAARIRGGMPVFFFPEGTRSRDGRLLPFKKGAFVIAVRAGVPVIPVVVSGTAALLPKGSILLRSGTVSVHYGEPIPTAGYETRGKEALMTDVRRAILARLGEAEAYPDAPGAVPAETPEPRAPRPQA
jgi:1-acyl-sn-glycerol-3-phosphate acyltransferase